MNRKYVNFIGAAALALATVACDEPETVDQEEVEPGAGGRDDGVAPNAN